MKEADKKSAEPKGFLISESYRGEIDYFIGLVGQDEYMVIGPAERTTAWEVFPKERRAAMGFGLSRLMPQRGLQKGLALVA